jgi:hypothetical protein
MKGVNKSWLRAFLWCGVCSTSLLIQVFSPETKAMLCTNFLIPGLDPIVTPGSSMERIK